MCRALKTSFRACRIQNMDLSVKTCAICRDTKPVDEFGVNNGKRSGPHKRQPYCKPCGRLNAQLRYHNMSLDDYNRMLAEQDGKCAVCGDGMDTPQIDHDHSCCPTGRSCGHCTRALLCKDCNFTLGWSRDDPGRLIAAAAYVLQHRGVTADALAV